MNETAQVIQQTGQNIQFSQPQNGAWSMIVYCIVIMLILYFFMIRPNKKRMAEYQKMLDSIRVGNRVLAAGIYGTGKKVNEKTLEVEIAKGVVVEINKNAVANIE